ncbi:MAG TPA: hypothetical protein VN972_04360, partial [Methylomirabilota bacterium]|nr:hypothetical protein [Methylomirabilota bacterium]
VIVGFPGEGIAEFEETRRFLEDIPVTFLHVFRYSSRPGTASARLEGAAPDAAARERSETLRALGESKARAFRRSLLGGTLAVVMEQGRGRIGPIAMSDVYLPVELTEEPLSRRGILDVSIVGEESGRLLGSPNEPLSGSGGAVHAGSTASRSASHETVSDGGAIDGLTL